MILETKLEAGPVERRDLALLGLKRPLFFAGSPFLPWGSQLGELLLPSSCLP